MSGFDLDIRTMTPADMDLAVEWAAQEGWNPGLHDAKVFRAADSDGFLMGWLGNEPVGCVSVVAYGQSFGFLGFYIVRPEFRGRGYGLRIWKAGMDRLAGRNIGLDGVVAQQDNYLRSGFRYAYANERFEGLGGGNSPGGVVDLGEISFKRIADYDSAIFQMPRESFLEGWVAPVDGHAFGVIKDSRLAGYGVMRPCRKGHKIGPLFADTPEIADCLLDNFFGTVPGDTVYLDVPRPNAAAVAMVKRHGMISVFETARMYTHQDPGVPIDRVYGVTTFELG